MGEIGIPRTEFLYHLQLWEIRAITRGYLRREQKAWERARWQTFWLLHNGMLDCNKAGLHHPADLVRFPWEKNIDGEDLPTDEEIEQTRRELQALNAQTKRKI